MREEYEVQLLRNSHWKLISSHDSEEEAVFIASKEFTRNGHSGVRVLAERYDDVTKKFLRRTVFIKTSKEREQENYEDDEARWKAMRQRRKRLNPQRYKKLANNRRRREKRKKLMNNISYAFLVAFVLVFCGLLLYGMEYLKIYV